MKIFCIGRNYVDHAKELNNKVPKKPLVFMKPSTALSHDKSVHYPSFTENLHHEIELVLWISKKGKNITRPKALSHIGAYALGIDYTARDVQANLKAKGHPWEIAKGFDGAATLSAFYHTGDFDLKKGIPFSLLKNGQLAQTGNTRDLLFPCDQLISYISGYFTLEVGDLIYTGTPAGVGPVKKGDVLEAYLGDRPVLENVIR